LNKITITVNAATRSWANYLCCHA